MDSANVVDHLIIGTGPSAVAAAMAFRRSGMTFEVVDVGFELSRSGSPGPRASRGKSRRRGPMRIGHLLSPAQDLSRRCGKTVFFWFGLPLPRPRTFGTQSRELRRRCSHGFGGFGNVWGAAVLPFADNDLVGWPDRPQISSVLSERCGIRWHGSSADDLEEVFPRFGEDGQRLIASRQIQGLAQAADRLKVSLQESGIWVGRSRSPSIPPGGRRRAATAGIA